MENNKYEPGTGANSIEPLEGHEVVHDNDSVVFVNPTAANARSSGSASSRKVKSVSATPFVTKKVFVITLIIAIICSSGIGALVASLTAMGVGSNSSFGGYENLSTTSLEAATGSKLTIQQIVAKNSDSVVEIKTETASTGIFGQAEVSTGAGSGVIVNEKGYIVTNNHVIDGARTISVTLHNGDEVSGVLVGNDPGNDIAVLKIPGNNYNAVDLGDSSKLAVGDLAVAIGNPLGTLGGSATQGVISSLERRLTLDKTTLNLLQTDAAINPGNSGGGLFNGAGELVGIVVAKSSGTGIEGLAFAIPITNIAAIIDDLIDDGKVSSKPAIGITIYEVTNETKRYYKKDVGVYISELTGTAAKDSGLKVDDQVISIEGKKIESSSDLISRVREHKVGEQVELEVSRDGKAITIKTTLEESVASDK